MSSVNSFQGPSVDLNIQFKSAPNQLDQPVKPGDSMLLPRGEENHQIKKGWLATKWEVLTTSKETRTDNKIRNGLEGLHKATGDVLTTLTALSKEPVPNGLNEGQMFTYALGMNSSVEKQMGHLREAASPALKRGVEMDQAFQARVQNHIKTADLGNLESLHNMLASVDINSSPHRAELGIIKAAVQEELGSRAQQFNETADKIASDLESAIKVINGTLTGPLTAQSDNRVFDIKGDATDQHTFRGLLMGVNQLAGKEGDSMKSHLLARAIGGLSNETRANLLEAIRENSATNLAMFTMAARSEGMPSWLDPEGMTAKCAEQVNHTMAESLRAQHNTLVADAGELTASFGSSAADAGTVPKSALGNSQELLESVIQLHHDITAFEAGCKVCEADIPDVHIQDKEALKSRLSELTGELAHADAQNTLANTLTQLSTQQLVQLEKALQGFEIQHDALNAAITTEQQNRRDELNGRYNEALLSALNKGIHGDGAGMIHDMLGYIDLRNSTSQEAANLASDVKFHNHVDSRGRNVDLLGAFNDPDLNMVLRDHYANMALTKSAPGMSVEDMKLLQEKIRSLGPLLTTLQAGNGIQPQHQGWGRNVASWLQSLDSAASKLTGEPPFDLLAESRNIQAAGTDNYLSALSEENKNIYSNILGYNIGTDGQITPNPDLQLEDILKGMRN